jgi:hypothetical protein
MESPVMDSNCPPVKLTRLIPYLLLGITLKLSLWAWMLYREWNPAEISDFFFEAYWIIAPWVCLLCLKPFPRISWPLLRRGAFLWTLSYALIALLLDSPILATHHFSPKILSVPIFLTLVLQLLSVFPCWLSIEAFLAGRKGWFQQLLALLIISAALPLSEDDTYVPYLILYYLLRRVEPQAGSALMGVQLAASFLGSQPLWGRQILGLFTQLEPTFPGTQIGLSGAFLYVFAFVLAKISQEQRKLSEKNRPLGKISGVKPTQPERNASS